MSFKIVSRRNFFDFKTTREMEVQLLPNEWLKIRSKVVLSLFGHSLVEFEDHLRRIKGPKPSPPLDTIQTL